MHRARNGPSCTFDVMICTSNPTNSSSSCNGRQFAFPTGSFAHSGGLETYAQAEIITTAGDLARLIAMKLESAAKTDLIIVHTALKADSEQILQLDNLCSASKVARDA